MSVLEPFTEMSPLSRWLPAFGIIVATNAFIALFNRPLGSWRWALAGFLSSAPATLPTPDQYRPIQWGALTLFATTLTICSAARLPDLDHALKTRQRGSWELFVWMSLPMARFSLAPNQLGTTKWVRIGQLLMRAGLKWLAWAPLLYLTSTVPGDSVPWVLRSAVLIFYFVLHVTALSDLMMCLTLVLGSDVDELFDSPLYSYSPRDFWSRRWNKYINRFALKHVSLRMRKNSPPALVVIVVFATSGLFHEYFSWGASPGQPSPGYMMGFFTVQGVAVWLGSRFSFPSPPHLVGTALTFAWMTLTAPFFFVALIPALEAFGFSSSWYPFFWRH